MEVLKTVTDEQIQTIIRNSKGLSGGLFIPEKGFESLVRSLIAKLEVRVDGVRHLSAFRASLRFPL